MISLFKYMLLPILAISLASGAGEQVLQQLQQFAKTNCRFYFNDQVLREAKAVDERLKAKTNYNAEYPEWNNDTILSSDGCHHYKFLKHFVDGNLQNFFAEDSADSIKEFFHYAMQEEHKRLAVEAWIHCIDFANDKVAIDPEENDMACKKYHYHGYCFYHAMDIQIKKCIDDMSPPPVNPFQ